LGEREQQLRTRRWTTTTWKQNDESLSLALNPRVIESRVGDATNTRKTTVDYVIQSGIALPNKIEVHDGNTVLKGA
jgi:hypothetical protein